MNLFIGALVNRKTFILKLRSEVCMSPVLLVQRTSTRLNIYDRFYILNHFTAHRKQENINFVNAIFLAAWFAQLGHLFAEISIYGIATCACRSKRCHQKMWYNDKCAKFCSDQHEAFSFLDKSFFGKLQGSVIEWQHICSQLSMASSSLINLFVRLSFYFSMVELASRFFEARNKLLSWDGWAGFFHDFDSFVSGRIFWLNWCVSKVQWAQVLWVSKNCLEVPN